MAAWFNWRPIFAAIVLGLIFASALFYFTDRPFSLGGLDLFFAVTTVISLGFNLWQIIRDKFKYKPLRNSLIGLFNGLKARQLRAYGTTMLIVSPNGQNLNREAIAAQFFDFVRETTQTLEEIREHVVAAIHTLDPDISKEEIFRAAEFGLTAQEKQFREQFMQTQTEQWKQAQQPASN